MAIYNLGKRFDECESISDCHMSERASLYEAIKKYEPQKAYFYVAKTFVIKL